MGENTTLKEQAGKLRSNPVVSAQSEDDRVTEGIGNFGVGQDRRA